MTNHSLYKLLTDKSSEVISLKEVFHQIASGKFQNQIQKLRTTPAGEERDRLKRSLPAFTPSGVFGGGRKFVNLENYPGIISLDFDKLTQVQLALAKSKLKENKYVLGFFVSPSGNGLKVFILTDALPTNHSYAFRTVKGYVEGLINLKADDACKDLTRLCFLSHDPAAFYNADAQTFVLFDKGIHKAWLTAEKKHDNQEGSRNQLVFTFAVICHANGYDKSTCEEYATMHSTLQRNEIVTAIKSAYSGKYFELVKGRQKYNAGKYGQLEEFLSAHYRIRFNVVTNKPEVATESIYQPLTDVVFNDILRHATENHVPVTEASLKVVLYSGYPERYDPFESYFKNLPEWDGYDYIQDLVDILPLKDKPRGYLYFTRWLTGVVACLLDEKVTNQHMIVLVGAQGIGKTNFFRSIIPEELTQYTYHGVIRPDDKDTIALLSDKAFIIVDELDQMRPHQLTMLKEVLTKPMVTIRRPYARTAENSPRRASLAASVNSPDFLVDPTGNRRYLVLEVLDQIAYTLDVDLEQLYSQVLALYRAQEPHWFTREEIADIEAANQDFVQPAAEEELLLQVFRPPHDDDKFVRLNATEVLIEVASRFDYPVGKFRPETMGKMLVKNGFPTVKVNGLKKYKVVRK